MYLDRYLRLFSGSFILISVVLGYLVSPWWLLFSGFVAFNLIMGGLFGWCPMIGVMRKMGVPEAPKSSDAACACDTGCNCS